MAMGSNAQGKPAEPNFGKRGKVRLTPAPAATQTGTEGGPASTFSNAFSNMPNPMKWAGGGLAVMALVAMLSVGTGGGGGFLSGLLGGMLAHRLMQGSPATTAAQPGTHGAAPGAAATNTSVTRGGFGATAGAHAGGSVSG